jgi:hypothetical protein
MSNRLLISLAILALSACEQEPIGPTLPTVDSSWRVIRAGGWQPALTSVLAFAPDDIYASHAGIDCDGDLCLVSESQLLHYNGMRWEELPLPPGAEYLSAMWGRRADDMYAIGRTSTLFHYDGSSWNVEPIRAQRIAGSSDHVFASDRETVFELTTAGWDTLQTLDDYVYALSAGEDGSLLVQAYREARLWNGVEWKSLISNVSIEDVLCFSATDAFVLKSSTGGSDVLRWDGVQLTTMATLPDRYPYAYLTPHLAGRNSSHVFVVGARGETYHCDGTVWSRAESGTTFDIERAAVLETGELVTVGENGKVSWYDGSGWQTLREAEPRFYFDIWAESESRFIVSTNGGAFILDGDSFAETSPPPDDVFFLMGYSMDDVYASSYRSILHFDGSVWSVDVDSLPTYAGPMWAGPNGSLYAVGNGAVYRRDGGWQRIYDGPIEFGAVSGRGTRVVGVGIDNTIPTGMVAEFNGTWKTYAIFDQLYDVVIASGSRIMVAGRKGVYREEGDRFVIVTPPSQMGGFDQLFEIATNQIIAFGYDNFAYFDGKVWSLQPLDRRGRELRQIRSGAIVGIGYGSGIGAWEMRL